MKSRLARQIGQVLVSAVTLVWPGRALAQVLHVADLNTEQLRSLDRARTAVIIPVGILEEHGPYLPSYTDGYGAIRLTENLAEAIVGRAGWTSLVFPAIPLGHGGANVIGGKFTYPGSFTVRAETLRAVLMDVVSDIGEQGFRWVFVVSTHGDPDHNRAIDQASDYFVDTYAGRMVNLFGLSFNPAQPDASDLTEAEKSEDGFSVHAGLVETSQMLFVRPDLVAASRGSARSVTGKDMDDLRRLGAEADWPGYFGAPRLASAAHGAYSLRTLSERTTSAALAILDGFDPQAAARYADTADQNPAIASLNKAVREHDRSVVERQQQWLQRRGLQ